MPANQERPRRACLRLILVLPLAWAAGSVAALADAPPPLDLAQSAGPERLTGHAEFLVDRSGTLTVDEIRAAPGTDTHAIGGPGQRPRFQALTAAQVNQGLSTDAYWVRLRVVNDTAERLGWTLLAEAAYIDHLDAWVFDSDGIERALDLSDRRPFSERPITYRTLGLAHATPPGGHSDIYMRASHDRLDTVHLGFRVVPEQAFAGLVARGYFGYGLLYGALLVLSIYALIVWCRGRDPRFGFYAAYVLCTALAWMAVNGHLHQFLLPGHTRLVNEGMHVLFLAVVATAVLFSRSFLQTRQILPRTDRVLAGLVALLIAGIVLRLLGLWTVPFLLSHFALPTLFALAFVGIAAWRRGSTYARWFVAAWLLFGGMLLVNGLHVVGAVSWLHAGQLYPVTQGLNLLEIVMLAIAQSDRIGVLERDQQAAEQSYRQLLESHNEMLEQMVGERTHELATAWAQAREESETDEETGLGNRRFFLRAGQHALAEPRSGAHQALVYFDLDRFKDINDTHGHAAGDAILRAFARELAAGVREGDLVARFGGEEFVLLLVNLRSVDESRRIVGRICQQFRDHPTEYNGHAIAHTVSAGVAIRPPSAQTGLRTLLARADLALYLAKDRGRDRVVVENGGREPADEVREPA